MSKLIKRRKIRGTLFYSQQKNVKIMDILLISECLRSSFFIKLISLLGLTFPFSVHVLPLLVSLYNIKQYRLARMPLPFHVQWQSEIINIKLEKHSESIGLCLCGRFPPDTCTGAGRTVAPDWREVLRYFNIVIQRHELKGREQKEKMSCSFQILSGSMLHQNETYSSKVEDTNQLLIHGCRSLSATSTNSTHTYLMCVQRIGITEGRQATCLGLTK